MAEQIEHSLGKARSEAMMRFYLHDNGRHAAGGGEPGTFQQSIQDLMAWVEKGTAPPPSTRYTIRGGQVIPPDDAADRHGLQPVMSLAADGAARAEANVNQPVKLSATLEMPPKTGLIVQYGWTIAGTADPMTVMEKPLPRVEVSRSVTFDKPGTYVVRLTVDGQRDGQVDPLNQALPENFREVRIVVR